LEVVVDIPCTKHPRMFPSVNEIGKPVHDLRPLGRWRK
jgi:hypothetical protein